MFDTGLGAHLSVFFFLFCVRKITDTRIVGVQMK